MTKSQKSQKVHKSEKSENKNKWTVSGALTEHRDEIDKIAAALDILPVTAALLYNRGYTGPDEARAFMLPDESVFYDPFLLCDMDRAVNRIHLALKNNEKIKIYGDYDVDGVTSVSLVLLYLRSRGADVSYYIPCRAGEGYGVSDAAIEAFAAEGVGLIITVDTGITAFSETGYASELGMDMIITDHHECHSRIPAAEAVINPRRPDCEYPFKDMAGVGVAFKLVCALEQGPGGEGYLKTLLRDYSDLAAIGTIADVMPLVGENRLIARTGLRAMEQNPRPGLRALLETASRGNQVRRVDSSLVGFVIAPRLNAAGRIADASTAAELFLTDSYHQAQRIAKELCEANSERQAQEQKIIGEAFEMIKAEHDFKKDRVIVLARDNWHHGVIGIVASRITERFSLPCVLISFEGDIGKGSGRSVKGLNLVEALSACADLLLKYGGHELAAGLSVERSSFGAFRQRINAYAAANMTPEEAPPVRVDAVLTSADLTLRQAKELRLLEPYGAANPAPLFTVTGAALAEITPVGNNRHTRLRLKVNGTFYNAIYFGCDPQSLNLYPGDRADVVFNLDINDYQNVQSVQLVIRDIGPVEEKRRELAANKSRYNEIKEGGRFGSGEDVIPVRADFAKVYLYIKHQVRRGNAIISVNEICYKCSGGLHYIKVKIIIDIFNETGIFLSEYIEDDLLKFTMSNIGEKVNLERSCIYRALQGQIEE
ncbi:MAG: single-stranded-DNA-specific exonuclease RecJ [Eubacteriales bacterium]|nr:single-stranded-DNA-specific exonuclease RecJ [Eubacteriales bacterium]